ncbi:hypothetical protein MBLNU230_g0813t1 [Neophaeotheca triangularis]
MKLILATFAALATTIAADPFGLIAARSASPIHLRPIEASGKNLYIGRQTATYCPEFVKRADGCPNKTPAEISTLFTGGCGSLSMSVVVPGGQQVYIDPATGAVGYTTAHSAAMPPDAVITGWQKEEGEQFAYLRHEDGLLACPVSRQEGVYQIFVQLEGLSFPATCLGFSALAPNSTTKSVGAWQYI